jgi:hypothetical protein
MVYEREHEQKAVPPRPWWRRWLPFWGVLLLLVTTPFPEYQLDLRTDESFTATYTRHETPTMVLEEVRKNEETPPVYFLSIWLWSRVAGSGEVALRLPSLLCAMLAVVLLVSRMQRWRSDGEALVAGAVVALSPLVARFVVEARVYGLLMLMTVACIAVFEYVYHHPQNRRALAGYALVAGVLFLTSYLGVVLLAAHNLVWLIRVLRHRAHWRSYLLPWVGVQAGIGVLVLPWFPSLLYQMHVAPAVTASPGFSLEVLVLLAMVLFLSIPRSHLLGLWLMTTALGWGLVASGVLLSRDRGNEERRSARGLALRGSGGPALMFVGFMAAMQLTAARYVTFLVPCVAVAAAVGWGELRRRLPRLGVVLAAVFLGGMLVYRLEGLFPPTPIERAWPQAVDLVAQQIDPSRDVVLFHPPWEQRIFEYYYEGPELQLLGAHHYDEFYAVQGHPFRESWTLDEALEVTRGSRMVWLFHNPAHYGMHRLRLPYRLVERWSFSRLELVRYDASAEPGANPE